jgi:hypothetical protein
MTAFHDDFSRALAGDPAAMAVRLGHDPHALTALRVYRNASLKGRGDALAANYPTVVQLVGDDWFHAAALTFLEGQPGDDPVLAGFGPGFPAWLARFAPALELPYLAPVARLDRAWTEAHLAADSRPMTLADARAAGTALGGQVLTVRPDVRLFRFDWTVPSLWLAHREPDNAPLVWEPRPEALLIHRPEAEVLWHRLEPAEADFLNACAAGRPAAAAALQAGLDPADPSGPIPRLLAKGLFRQPDPEPRS